MGYLKDMWELIDTLWNVNDFLKYVQKEFDKELIDTLWNVNKSLQTIANQAQQELIDTLWNVNALAYLLDKLKHKRINRYIMECKCAK